MKCCKKSNPLGRQAVFEEKGALCHYVPHNPSVISKSANIKVKQKEMC